MNQYTVRNVIINIGTAVFLFCFFVESVEHKPKERSLRAGLNLDCARTVGYCCIQPLFLSFSFSLSLCLAHMHTHILQKQSGKYIHVWGKTHSL